MDNRQTPGNQEEIPARLDPCAFDRLATCWRCYTAKDRSRFGHRFPRRPSIRYRHTRQTHNGRHLCHSYTRCARPNFDRRDRQCRQYPLQDHAVEKEEQRKEVALVQCETTTSSCIKPYTLCSLLLPLAVMRRLPQVISDAGTVSVNGSRLWSPSSSALGLPVGLLSLELLFA